MLELLEQIKSEYLIRTENIDEQKKIWIKLSEQFRPDLTLYRAARPSTITARETGDLGLSVLWIVQASLIRPILKELVLKSENDKDLSEMLSRIGHSSLSALAHSEDSNAPVTLTETAKGFVLNGEKKFITAGKNAELMIVTCRIPGEEKISHIALIDSAALPENALPDLNLEIMRSVSHTKLVLNNVEVHPFQVPRLDGSVIRRMMKKYGILERAMILEAFLSYMLYAEKILNEAGAGLTAYDGISSLLEHQSASVTKQIDEAVYTDRIDTQNIPLQKVFPLVDEFKKAYINKKEALSDTEKIKLKDLFLFDSLKG
ncbi:MAG: hypothetical protein CVV49_07785 [Spirochaetae bacterium HGW-Spirochaetae-5]|nr:MAG: hypothetical protein CVV49_07785 [Spirochaetae bacterium HGW-Spirochaetae-5]